MLGGADAGAMHRRGRISVMPGGQDSPGLICVALAPPGPCAARLLAAMKNAAVVWTMEVFIRATCCKNAPGTTRQGRTPRKNLAVRQIGHERPPGRTPGLRWRRRNTTKPAFFLTFW